jgi:hypothetical protein
MDGVRRPVDADGVTRPLEIDTDGVMRPPMLDDAEGVIRPLRDEATEEGRYWDPGPTVGADNLVVATKTPHLGGQVKYCLPATEPSFLPLPAKPPPSSTPAHKPGFPSISPTNLKIPS